MDAPVARRCCSALTATAISMYSDKPWIRARRSLSLAVQITRQGAIVTPDRHWILYATTSAASRLSDPLNALKPPESARLMRAPIAGGPSSRLVREQGSVEMRCTHTAVKQCVLLERDQKQLTFSALD